MMNHEQYRRAVLANPLGTDPELEAHRASCEDCRAFTDGVLTFEHQLVRALKVSTPISARILPFGTRSTARPTKGDVGLHWQRAPRLPLWWRLGGAFPITMIEGRLGSSTQPRARRKLPLIPTKLMFDSLQSIALMHGLLPYDRHDQNICLDHRVRPGRWAC
jgi:hypothetical protein